MALTESEIGIKGSAIYRRLRDRLEANSRGQFVAIDVISGEYEIDADYPAAKDRLLARVPEAAPWGARVGPARQNRVPWWHLRPAGQDMSWLQIKAKGDAWYEKIRKALEADYPGHFVFIEVASGAYEVALDSETAKGRMTARFPDAALWGTRVATPDNTKKASADD